MKQVVKNYLVKNWFSYTTVFLGAIHLTVPLIGAEINQCKLLFKINKIQISTQQNYSLTTPSSGRFHLKQIQFISGAGNVHIDPTGSLALVIKEMPRGQPAEMTLTNIRTGQSEQIRLPIDLDLGVNFSSLSWNNSGTAFSFVDYSGNKIYVKKIRNPYNTSASRRLKSGSFDINTNVNLTKWSLNDQWVYTKSYDYFLISDSQGNIVFRSEDVISATWHPSEPIVFYTTKNRDVIQYNPETRESIKISSDADASLDQNASPGLLSLFLNKNSAQENQPKIQIIENPLTPKASGGSTSTALAISQFPNLKDSDGVNTSMTVKSSNTMVGKYFGFKKEPVLYPGRLRLFPLSPDGRFLVSARLTGREWMVDKSNPDSISGSTTTHTIHEYKIVIKDLTNGENFVVFENYVKTFGGEVLLERMTLIWTSMNTFAIGRLDGSMPPVVFSVENGIQKKRSNNYNIIIGKDIYEGRHTYVETPNNEIWQAKLNEKILSIKGITSDVSTKEIDIPLANVLSNANSRISSVEILSFNNEGEIILNVMEEAAGGALSRIVKFNYRQ